MTTVPTNGVTKAGRKAKAVSDLAATADPADPFVGTPTAKCKAIAQAGVQTDRDFANLMSALMGDLSTGAISTEVANAMVNAGGKLLKVVEMRLRYGTKEGEGKVLMLRT